MIAMIFAAGLGTRLQPLTLDKPKALVEIGGVTLLERCIRWLQSQQINDIVINVHHFAELVEDFLRKNQQFGANIQLSDERQQLLDTGGAILQAKPLLQASTGPIVLVNVDILSNLNLHTLIAHHEASGNLATLVVRRRNLTRCLLFHQEMLCGWKNLKSGELKVSRPEWIDQAEELGFSGIQVISPQLLELITEQGAFSSIDMYLRLAQNHSIGAFLDSSSIWMDLGKYEDIHLAQQIINKC